MNADEIYDKIKEIIVVKVTSGDVICIKLDCPLTEYCKSCIEDTIQPLFPNNKILFIDKSLDITSKKTIIEAEKGEWTFQFYDRMLEYVKDNGSDVYGVFNDQFFIARSNAKEYSDIKCFSGRYDPSAEMKKKGTDNMKKLFISQPMRGKSNEEIIAEREKAVKAAAEKLGEPVEVIDSFFKDAPVTASPLWFLGKSLEALAGADIVYFCEGWDTARGCKIEQQCAVEYGIDRLYA